MIGLETFGFHVATEPVPIDELPGCAELTTDTFGIQSVSVATDLTGFDLALLAAQDCVARDPAAGRGIGAVILAALRVPTAFVASDATRLQHRLGFDDVMAFSVGDLGCASSSMAISVATALLAQQPWDRVLVVHGAKAPASLRHRRPVTVLGDAGGAVIVGRDPRFEVLASREESDGRFWDLFSVSYESQRSQWQEICRDEREFVLTLAVETRRRVSRLVADVLDEAGLRKDQVACLVTQNTSVGALKFHQDVTGIELDGGCADNLRRYGHLGPVDIMLNLADAIERLPDGAHVLTVNSSPAAAWSVSVGRVRR